MAHDKAELRDLKKALSRWLHEVLIFQDEVEIHRQPTLTRLWAPVGCQPEVPAPGKNEKKVIYGGVDYATGKLTYTVADSKCGTAFLAFLRVLLKTYTGRKIRMVCDNGRFHRTKAVSAFAEANRDETWDRLPSAVLPGSQSHRTPLGSSQANRIGECLIPNAGRLGGRVWQRCSPCDREARTHGLHV